MHSHSPSLQSKIGINAVNFFIAEMVAVVLPFLSDFLKQNNWRYDQIGFATALVGMGTFLFQTPAGIVIDKVLQRRALLAGASLAVGVGCLIIPFVVSSPLLVDLFLFLAGASSTFFGPLLSVLALSLAGKSSFGPMLGLNQAWSHAGNIAAAYITVSVVQHFGVGSVFYVIFVMSVLTSVLLLVIKKSDLKPTVDPQKQKRRKLKDDLLELISDPRVKVLLLATAIFHLANAPVVPLLALHIRALGGNDHQLAMVVMIAQFIMVPVAWMAGKYCQDMGRKTLYGLAYILLPIRILLYSLTQDINILLAIQVLDGIVSGVYAVVIALVCNDLTQGKTTFNSLMGFAATALALGTVVGPLVQGYLTGAHGLHVYVSVFCSYCRNWSCILHIKNARDEAKKKQPLTPLVH